MSALFFAAVYAAFIWWFSTGVIFYLNARPPSTFRWSMLVGTAVLLASIWGIWATAGMQTAVGAYISFTCGVLIWGWHTMSYYMGVITGPRRDAGPRRSRGWKHFLHAAETGLYHEIAIIANAAALVLLTLDQPNQYGLWTFVVLWAMHVSAKLNVFLGVRNLNKDFIPKHMTYLTRFFRRRSMNLLFPLSVSAGTVVTVLLAQTATSPLVGEFVATGHALIATLMALAVIEHWFMMLPIPADALWRWSLEPAPVRRADGPDKSGRDAVEVTQNESNSIRSQPVSGRLPETGTAGHSSRGA